MFAKVRTAVSLSFFFFLGLLLPWQPPFPHGATTFENQGGWGGARNRSAGGKTHTRAFTHTLSISVQGREKETPEGKHNDHQISPLSFLLQKCSMVCLLIPCRAFLRGSKFRDYSFFLSFFFFVRNKQKPKLSGSPKAIESGD